MSSPVINTAAGAFVLGLVTSLHCATMCGPLLCTAVRGPGTGYHLGRFVSYTSLGAVAGAVGEVPLRRLMDSPLRVLPWVLVLLLAGLLAGWKLRLPRPLFLRRFTARQTLKPESRWKSFSLGALTPLLPCGPLYLVLAACLVSGSALQGARFAAAFTMGTIPLLWLSGQGWGRLRQHLAPARLRLAQRVLAGLALGMLLWRLNPFQPAPEEGREAEACPLCAAGEPMP